MDWVDAQLYHCTKLGARLAFELPERTAIELPEQVLRLASILRRHGALLGVDYCGAHDLALEYMKRFKAGYAKIEAAFVCGAMQHQNRRSYVLSLIEFCHGLDVQVIVERVETQEEYVAACELGADGVQGFFIGAPAP